MIETSTLQFRIITDNNDILPHPRRHDEANLPHLLHVTFTTGRKAGYRFIYAGQPVKTPRQILELQAWLAEQLLSPALILMHASKAEEEVSE